MCYVPFEGNLTFIQDRNLWKVGRTRRNFCGTGASVTVYASVYHNSNHGELTVVFGNDTLERPIAGGLQIEEAIIATKAPARFQLIDKESSGIGDTSLRFGYDVHTVLKNVTLGDGQTAAFRGRYGIFPVRAGLEYESYLASFDNPTGSVLLIADSIHFDNAKALGSIPYMPKSHFTDKVAASNALEHHCSKLISGGPFTHFGFINKSPGSTGDQSDFMAGNPIFVMQTAQTGNPCRLREAQIAVTRESLRPSYYWFKNERAQAKDFPELFLWSSRPHFDPSWNNGKGPEYIHWTNRDRSFNAGTFNGWGIMDNQHFGHNSLRGYYELTGDSFAGDLLKAWQDVTYWNYYTGLDGFGWFKHTDAPRAYGRLTKEAIMLLTYWPETDTANRLRTRIAKKNREVILPMFADVGSTYKYQGFWPGGDPRVPNWSDCMAGKFTQTHGLQPTSEDCAMNFAWQTGFVHEALTQMVLKGVSGDEAREIQKKYLDQVNLFFASGGSPVTYFNGKAPQLTSLGGIGMTWWAGWYLTAQLNRANTGSAFLMNKSYPLLIPMFQPGSRNMVDNHWVVQSDWQVK